MKNTVETHTGIRNLLCTVLPTLYSEGDCENLLIYRYNQLPKAIENARKLGFKEGAALFPQVTYSGEECHSEWEITFEEIHRNNIIVYAIVQHAVLTGNMDYIAQYGLEVMIAVSRFWSQRVSFSTNRNMSYWELPARMNTKTMWTTTGTPTIPAYNASR